MHMQPPCLLPQHLPPTHHHSRTLLHTTNHNNLHPTNHTHHHPLHPMFTFTSPLSNRHITSQITQMHPQHNLPTLGTSTANTPTLLCWLHHRHLAQPTRPLRPRRCCRLHCATAPRTTATAAAAHQRALPPAVTTTTTTTTAAAVPSTATTTTTTTTTAAPAAPAVQRALALVAAVAVEVPICKTRSDG